MIQLFQSKKGLHSLGQRFLFGVVVGMFLLSTGYLSVSMADFIILIKTWYLDVHLSESAGSKTPLDSLLVLFNALSVINVGASGWSRIDC